MNYSYEITDIKGEGAIRTFTTCHNCRRFFFLNDDDLTLSGDTYTEYDITVTGIIYQTTLEA